MIKVKCLYTNEQNKKKTKDYFVYTDIEVQGHADHTGYTNNIKVCAGVSACCSGIVRLIDDGQFTIEIGKGYFHIWTCRTKHLRQDLDRESVYALNTLVCQLYELYCEYPNAFKSFELIDVKEKLKNYDEREPKQQPFRKKRRTRRMGLLACIQEPHSQEN